MKKNATKRQADYRKRHRNFGIGHFRDDPSLLRAAAAYLERGE